MIDGMTILSIKACCSTSIRWIVYAIVAYGLLLISDVSFGVGTMSLKSMFILYIHVVSSSANLTTRLVRVVL
jgi:hypothetical protein